MLRRFAPILVSSLALSACALAPDYHPPVVATPAAYEETGPWSTAKPADDLSRGPWWERFGDQTLNSLEQQVDAASPTLAAAVARYDQARALAGQARAGRFPQISAGGSLSMNRQSDDRPLRGPTSPSHYDANQLDTQASYELDFWQRARNRAIAGTALAQAGAADVASAKLGLQAELANDYFALRGLDADADLLARTVTEYRKARDLTQRMFDGKIVGGIDVSRAETQLAAAEAQAQDVASRRAVFEHAIAVLVGQPPASFSLPRQSLLANVPEIPVGVPSTLLQRRPDIASAERKMAAANAEIGIARAAFYPTLSLGILGGTQATNLNLLSAANGFWALGPSVSLPIFQGGALKAKESGAYARFRETAAVYRSTVLDAFAEVEDNLALLNWLGQETSSEDRAVASAQRTLDLALNLYRHGIDSYLKVVTAQTPLLDAQRRALDLRTRRLQAAIALVRALGGGWSEGDLPTPSQARALAANATEAPTGSK